MSILAKGGKVTVKVIKKRENLRGNRPKLQVYTRKIGLYLRQLVWNHIWINELQFQWGLNTRVKGIFWRSAFLATLCWIKSFLFECCYYLLVDLLLILSVSLLKAITTPKLFFLLIYWFYSLGFEYELWWTLYCSIAFVKNCTIFKISLSSRNFRINEDLNGEIENVFHCFHEISSLWIWSKFVVLSSVHHECTSKVA